MEPIGLRANQTDHAAEAPAEARSGSAAARVGTTGQSAAQETRRCVVVSCHPEARRRRGMSQSEHVGSKNQRAVRAERVLASWPLDEEGGPSARFASLRMTGKELRA